MNGPPVLPDETFYFHHTDPDFEKLLPQVDRSRYERTDGPATQANPGREEISDSQESAKPTCSDPSVAVATRCNASTQLRALQPVTHAFNKGACGTRPTTNHQTTSQPGAAGRSNVNNASDSSILSQQEATAEPNNPRHTSVPIITITGPESMAQCSLNDVKTTAMSISVPQQNVVAFEVPKIEDVYELSRPTSPPIPRPSPPSDTQDTALSTQPSDIFSQPADFMHFTPPTQDSQQVAMSQLDAFDTIETVSVGTVGAEFLHRLPKSTHPMPTLGKRPHDTPDTSDNTSRLKRSKLAK